MNASARLLEIVAANRAGRHLGIPSYCTAHPETLLAILRAYRDDDEPILIEATCNQVNQFGGYTGMTPAKFRDFVIDLAARAEIGAGRIILGGDHLGPNPWRHEPASAAMAKAGELVRAYVEAGFTKIHLDASMACGGDTSLSDDEIARRAAWLGSEAERQGDPGRLVYVIGTEVPKPGGETETLGGLAITEPQAATRTWDLHREAFAAAGASAAMDRVIGIVVQPGVDFGNSQVFGFDAGKAKPLSAAIRNIPGAVFEAHSTDYQSAASLNGLVGAHFAILKVGPELTAAYREAVVAMAAIESWLPGAEPSNVLDVVEQAMLRDPKNWRDHVPEGPDARMNRLFGLSDRIRYYWPDASIQAALARLQSTIDGIDGASGLVSQYVSIPKHIAGSGLPLSQQIVQAKVGAVVEKYAGACRSTG